MRRLVKFKAIIHLVIAAMFFQAASVPAYSDQRKYRRQNPPRSQFTSPNQKKLTPAQTNDGDQKLKRKFDKRNGDVSKPPPQAKKILNQLNEQGPQRIIGQGYLKLLLGMMYSDMFWAATSGDPHVVWEFFRNISSLDFHLTMGVFEASMGISRLGITKLALAIASEKSELEAMRKVERWQTAMSPWILSIGDIVSSYFSEIYHHPRMQALWATYDVHKGYADPADPNSRDTDPNANSSERRKLVRQQILNNIVSDVLYDVFSNGQGNFSRFYHGFQMGVVVKYYEPLKEWFKAGAGEGPGKNKAKLVVSEKVIIPLKQSIKNGVVRFAPDFVKYWPEGIRLLNASIAESAENLTKVAIIQSIKMDLTQLVSLKTALNGLFTGTVSTGIFFIVNEIVGQLITPEVVAQQQLNNVDYALKELGESLNWYMNPARGEDGIPWFVFNNNPNEMAWLRFFKEGGNFNSEFFKQGENKWHAPVLDAINLKGRTWEYRMAQVHPGRFYKQAYSFMSNFSAKYLGVPIDDSVVTECENFNNGGCLVSWYTKTIPEFSKAVNQMKAENLIRAQIIALNQAYAGFRNGTVMKDVLGKFSVWSKDVTEKTEFENKREKYFKWIAKGMSFEDSSFLINEGLWHPSASKNWSARTFFDLVRSPKDEDEHAFANEALAMVVDFDKRVFGKVTDYFELEVNTINFSSVNFDFSKLQFNTIGDFFNSAFSAFYYINGLAERPGAAQAIMTDHEKNIIESVKFNSKDLKREDIVNMIKDFHSMAFSDRKDLQKTNEQIKTESNKIDNLFKISSLQELLEEQKAFYDKMSKAKMIAMQNEEQSKTEEGEESDDDGKEDKRSVSWINWFANGMNINDQSYIKNENNWNPGKDTKKLDELAKAKLAVLISQPIFNNRQIEIPKQLEKSDLARKYFGQARAEFDVLNNDVMSILQNNTGRITPHSRDRLTVMAMTHDVVEKMKEALTKEVAEENIEFRKQLFTVANGHWSFTAWGYMNHEISAKNIWSGLMARDKSVIDKNGTFTPFEWKGNTWLRTILSGIFTKAPIINYLTAGWFNGKSLPSGLINTYNHELEVLLYLLATSLIDYPAVKPVDVTPEFSHNLGPYVNLNKNLNKLAFGLEAAMESVPQGANPNNDIIDANVVGLQLATTLYEKYQATEISDLDILADSKSTAAEKKMAEIRLDQGDLILKTLGKLKSLTKNQSIISDRIVEGYLVNERTNLYKVQSSLLSRTRSLVNLIKKSIDDRGNSWVSEDAENVLRNNIHSLIVPVMAVTVGSNDPNAILAKILAEQLIEVENDKTIHGRMACYMLQDKLCKP